MNQIYAKNIPKSKFIENSNPVTQKLKSFKKIKNVNLLYIKVKHSGLIEQSLRPNRLHGHAPNEKIERMTT